MIERAQKPGSGKTVRAVHVTILSVLHLVMAAELVLLVIEEQWMHVFLVVGIMVVMLLPVFLKARLPVKIPHEVQIVAIAFVFAALFLGEIRGYYERFWWWDLALHGTAGFLLGILGFMVVYLLNENELVDLHMRPSFVALFAFCFSQALGALWEIFEFIMDSLFGLTMQKPMLGDPSGLTDTMWDLQVNAIGAVVMSLLGWRYLRRAQPPS